MNKIVTNIIIVGVWVIGILVLDTFLRARCGKDAEPEKKFYEFHRAILFDGDDRIEFNIVDWVDFDDSDMVQFVTEDGKIYYTHSSRVILIGEEEDENAR